LEREIGKMLEEPGPIRTTRPFQRRNEGGEKMGFRDRRKSLCKEFQASVTSSKTVGKKSEKRTKPEQT